MGWITLRCFSFTGNMKAWYHIAYMPWLTGGICKLRWPLPDFLPLLLWLSWSFLVLNSVHTITQTDDVTIYILIQRYFPQVAETNRFHKEMQTNTYNKSKWLCVEVLSKFKTSSFDTSFSVPRVLCIACNRSFCDYYNYFLHSNMYQISHQGKKKN